MAGATDELNKNKKKKNTSNNWQRSVLNRTGNLSNLPHHPSTSNLLFTHAHTLRFNVWVKVEVSASHSRSEPNDEVDESAATMVCLLQLSEQLHFSRWVQAQVRALLICDITTAAPWEFIPNAQQQLPGAAIRIDEELRAETTLLCVLACGFIPLFFPRFFARLCSRWSSVNNDTSSRSTDDCL